MKIEDSSINDPEINMRQSLINRKNNETDYNKILVSEEINPSTIKIKKEKKEKLKKSFFSNYCRLVNLSLNHKILFIFANSSLFITSFSTTLIPYICGKIIDSINNKQPDKLSSLCWFFVLVAITGGVSRFFKDASFDLLGARVVRDLRIKLFDSLIKKDIEFFDCCKTGDLISRIGSDVAVINNSCSETLSSLIKNFISFILSFGFLFSISYSLTLYVLLIVPPIVFTIIFFKKFFRKLSKQYQNSIAEASGMASELFGNIRVVKSFSTERKEIKKYSEKINHSYNLAYKNCFIHGFFTLLLSLCGYLAILFVLGIGGLQVLDGLMTSGQLSSFILYTITLSTSVIYMGQVNKIFNAVAVSEKIFELIDTPTKIYSHSNIEDSTRNETSDFIMNKEIISIHNNGIKKEITGNISMKNVAFSYPSKDDVEILSNINITVQSGEKIAIVGSSGSGKSTIVSLLERFYDCGSGEISFDGIDLKRFNLENLHQQIGFVSQEPTLFSGTIKDNIIYGLDKYDTEMINKATQLANAYDFINDSKKFPNGLETVVGERGIQLSGGQKQRIAIARALIKNPKILIFDEATSALDSESEFQVQEAINSLMDKGDTTIIIIAHRLSTIINCDRILVMKNGAVVEEGNHNNLLSLNGYYKFLIEKQISSFTEIL